MATLDTGWKIAFSVVAVLWSTFLAVWSVPILGGGDPRIVLPPGRGLRGWWNRSRVVKAWPWHVYQVGFNFIGCVAGWLAVWVLNPAACLRAECSVNVTWGTAALATAAFAGVTGHLPAAFARLLAGIAGVLALLAQWLEEKLAKSLSRP